jgi:excinuclease ABC subunit C
MMQEILKRRFRHPEWRFPDLILIDGGVVQVGIARQEVKAAGLKIPVLGLAKGPDRKKNELIGGPIPAFTSLETLIKVRDEAHRFAIGAYRRKHRKTFLK